MYDSQQGQVANSILQCVEDKQNFMVNHSNSRMLECDLLIDVCDMGFDVVI
jgi:hypothetical protein